MSVQVETFKRDDGDYGYRCYSTTDGIKRQRIGCSHQSPRSAINHKANLFPFVSPLPPRDGSTAGPPPLRDRSSEPSLGVEGLPPANR